VIGVRQGWFFLIVGISDVGADSNPPEIGEIDNLGTITIVPYSIVENNQTP